MFKKSFNIQKLNNLYFIIRSIRKHILINNYLKTNINILLHNTYKYYKFFIKYNYCIYSNNTKIFNKFSFYCRHILLKQIQNGNIFGINKTSW